MEAIAIACMIAALGYSIKDTPKEKIRNIDVNDPERQVGLPAIDAPSAMNIYHSEKVDAVNAELLQQSLNNYVKAENPEITGVISPVYNATAFPREPIAFSKIVNVKQSPQEPIAERPAFNNSLKLGTPDDSTNWSTFGTRPMDQQTSLLDNTVINTTPRNGVLPSSIEPFSLLSGESMEFSHSNMTPFFGSTVKQNMSDSVYESTLDRYSGKTSTFFHKKETAPLFESFQQDIHGTPAYPESFKDAFVQSRFRQGEKPFQSENVAAPIARTENPITWAQNNQPTVDDLRTANKPKITYDGRTVDGQKGSVRGYQAPVERNKNTTHFENNYLFTTTGVVTGDRSRPEYIVQDTARQDLNLEYFGNAAVGVQGASQRVRTDSIDNSHELDPAMFQAPRKNQLRSDTDRNPNSVLKTQTDRGSYNMPELQRPVHDTVLNATGSVNNSTVRVQDNVSTTVRETLDQINADNLNIKTTFTGSASAAYNDGINDVSLKTTQKEMFVETNYTGNAQKSDAMGYAVAVPHVKPTNKEIFVETNYTGNAYKSDTMGYAVAIPHIKPTNKEINVRDTRNAHHAHFKHIPGGQSTIGDVKLTQNMALKSKDNKHLGNIGIAVKSLQNDIGTSSSIRNNASEYANTRFNGDDIRKQLKDNVFALHA